MRARLHAALGCLLACTALTAAGQVSAHSRSRGRLDGLYVSGRRLVNGTGAIVHLHGVNRSGTEYACIQGRGIFDGPSDAASVAAMASWHINIVRIPLNEDCWLGINGVKSRYGGANYRKAIIRYVDLLHRYGMYAELSLMWAAPGTAQATYQSNAPDEDHSPAVWSGMAAAFKNDPDLILAPWGETTVDWRCFMRGCENGATFAATDGPFDGDTGCGSGCDHYTAAGIDQAVKVMRRAGYHGPIAIPCIEFANICADPSSGGDYAGGTWLSEHPADPDGQLIAEVHVYGLNTCDTVACLDVSVAPILAAGHPVIFAETGETYNDSDSGTSYISTFMNWADAHGVGYEAWTWDAWGTIGSLISDYDGSPNGVYGAYVRRHYLSTFG